MPIKEMVDLAVGVLVVNFLDPRLILSFIIIISILDITAEQRIILFL